jgi:hypothetical protein
VNHTTETIATLDTSLAPLRRRRERRAFRVRRSEGQRSVRSVDVVVVHEGGKGPLELLVVQDQQPVQTLRANGAHEPLRLPVRLRGTKRHANNFDRLDARTSTASPPSADATAKQRPRREKNTRPPASPDNRPILRFSPSDHGRTFKTARISKERDFYGPQGPHRRLQLYTPVRDSTLHSR